MSLFNSSKKKKKTAVSPLVRGSAAAGAAAQARAKKSTTKKQKPKQTVQPAKAAMSKAPVAKKKTTATSASGRNDAAVRQSYGQRAGTRTSSGAYKPTQKNAYNYKKAETKRSTISTDIKNQTKVKTQKPSVVSGPVKESRDNRDARMRQSWSQRHPENQVQREQRNEKQRPKSYVPTKGMAIPNKGQSAYDAEIEDFTRKYVQAGKLNPNERAGIAQGPMKDKGPIDLSTARDYDTMLSGGTVPGKYIPDENKVGALEYNIRMMGKDTLSKPYAEEIFKNASPSEQAQLVKAARETVGFNEQTDRWAKEADKARANASAEEQVRVNDAISGTRRDQYGQVVNSREKLQDYIYRTSTDKYNSAVKQQQFVDQWAKEHGTTAEDYLRSRFNTGAGGFVQSVWDGLFLPAESVKDYDRPGYYLGGFKAPHEGISKDKNILQNSWQWYTNLTSDAITMALLPYKAIFKNTAERSDNFRQNSQNLYDLAMKWTGQDERIVRQEALRRLNESMGKDQNPATQFVGDALEATVQMVPGMALSVVDPAVGMALFVESAGGMYARSALDNGASLEEALTYGTMCGALEGAVEKIFPFMGTYGRSFSGGMLAKMLGGRTTRGKVLFDSVVRDLSSNAFRQSMRGRILIGLGESLGEFTEEALMEVIEPFVRKSTYDAMADYASLEEIGMAGLLGAAIGVGLHAPSIGAATTGTLAKSVYISNQKLFAKAEYEDAVTRATNMADMGIISKELAERSIKEAKEIYDRNMAELAGVSGTGSLLDEERQGGEYKTSSNLEHLYSNRQEANAATVEPGTSAYFMEDGEVKRITHSEAGVKSEDAVLTNSEKTAYAEKAERLRTAKNNTERTGVQANVRQDIIDQASEMARVYNRNVEFYRDEEAAKRYDDRGRFDPKTETIYVNAATDKPLQTIISHEMVHAMRNTNAFKELLQEIKTYYKDSYDADVNDIRRMYSERDESGNVIEPSEGIIQEEVVAHFVEKKLLTDEAWVNTFLTNSRTDKILRGINTLLQRGLGGKEARFLASVRSKWLNALEEERGEQTALRAEAVAAAKEMRSARGKYSRNHQPTNVEERTPETYEGIWLEYTEYKRVEDAFIKHVFGKNDIKDLDTVWIYSGGMYYRCVIEDADSATFKVISRKQISTKDIEMYEKEEEKYGFNRSSSSNGERNRENGKRFGQRVDRRDSRRANDRKRAGRDVELYEERNQLNELQNNKKTKRNGRQERKRLKSLNDIYMKAVGEDDMETAQRLVNQVAWEAGYKKAAFHGTNAVFSKFDRKKIGKGTDRYGAGFYFTSDEEGAGQYGKNIMDVFLRLNLPFIVEDGDAYQVKFTKDQAYRILKKHPLINSEEENILGDYFPEYWKEGAQDWMIKELAAKNASLGLMDAVLFRDYPNELHRIIREELGRDGVIAKQKDGSIVYVAWFPQQIKSSKPVTYDDNGDIIPLDKRFNRRKHDTRYAKGSRDSEYLSAVERGDMETAQRLVDEAAKKAGYTVDVYHGTYSFGRTRFDLFGEALFLTDSVGVARNFSGGQPARSIKDNFDADTSPLNDVINYAKENTYIGDQLRFATIDDFDREADRIRPDEGLLKYGQDIYDSNVRMYEILQELRDDFLDGTTYLYMDYNSIGDDYANVPVFTEQTLREFVKNYKPNPSYSGGGVYRLVLRPKKMITINVNGGYYTDVPIPKELEKFATKEEIMRGYATSDQILRMANGAGYDTVKYAEMREGGDYGNAGISNVYATLNATENVKSADPVTYDDNDKVIPLSERFNPENDDLRYAKGQRRSSEAVETAKYHTKKLKYALYNRDRADNKELWDMLRTELNKAYGIGAYDPRVAEKIIDFAYRTGYQLEDNGNERFSLREKISIPEEYRGEMESLGGLAAVNRSIFGTGTVFTYKNNGIAIDEAYGEARDMRPDLFPETDNPSEQVQNIIDALTKVSDKIPLEELDREEDNPFEDSGDPIYNEIRDAVIAAMDDIAAIGRIDMVNRAKREGKNLSAKAQYRKGRESGKKQGQRSGYNTAKREQDRTDRATMREFDKLERQRAIDRAKQENQDRRDDEATMREFDNVMKKVKQDERKLSQQEKKELRKNYESREKDIRAEKNRLIHRLRVEKRSWQDAAERMEAERKKQQRSLDTKQRQEMRKKQQRLDAERRQERIDAALEADNQRKIEAQEKGTAESLYKQNRSVQRVIDDFRTRILQRAAEMGAFKKEGALLLDHNDVAIAKTDDGFDYHLYRDKNVVPSFALTVLAEHEGMKKEDFYGVYAELQRMQTERNEKGARVYSKRDILEYIVSLDIPAKHKTFLYFDVMKYGYDKKPVFKDGGTVKVKPGNYYAGDLADAIDKVGLDMFSGAGVQIATGKTYQIGMEDVEELLDLIFTDPEMKDVFRPELIEMITDFEADIEAARMLEQTNLLTDNPKEVDSMKNRIIGINKEFKRSFLAEGEAFERLADIVKNPLVSARYYAAKAANSIARDYINGHGVRSLSGEKGKGLSTSTTKKNGDVTFKEKDFSLNNIMKTALKGTKESDALLKDLTSYVYARHNIDRMQYDKGFMELSVEECREIVDELGKNQEIVEMADNLVEYGQRLLQLCVESGMISQEDYEYFTTKYPHYVPTFRLREDEVFDRNGNVVRRTNKVIKEATKSNADMLPLYDQMVRRTQEIVKACKKNQLANELVKVANKDGAWDFIIDVKPAEPTSGNDDYIYMIGQIEDRGLKNRDQDGEDNYIPVYINGVKYNIEAADKNLLYGWDRLNYYRDEGVFLKTMRGMNNLRRYVLTQYNPIFWATNGIKDSIDMYLYNQHAHRLPFFQAKAFTHVFTPYENGRESFAEYLSFGAASASFFDYDERRRSKAKKAKDYATIGFKAIDAFNFMVEQWPRYTVYLEETDRLTKERKKGTNEYSDEEIKTIAAHRAADATVNFGRSGTVVKAANSYGATFLNAGVQGMDRFRRMFTQVKGETKRETLLNVIGLAIKLAAVGLAPSMLMDWIYGGDDDDEANNPLLRLLYGDEAAKVVQEYSEMADYERINYLNIRIPGHEWMRIPKGRVVSFIYGFDYNGQKVLSGDMTAMDMAYAQWELFAENIMPGNPLTNNIIQPLLEAKWNRDFWGNEIVSQWTDAGDGFHWTETNEDTSTVAEKAAEWIHKIVSRGKEFSPKYLDFSPIKIDYIMQQYLGSWNNIFQPFISAIGDGQDQRFVDMIQDAFKDSMWGKFYLDPVMSNRLAGDYYDLQDEYNGLSEYYDQNTPYAVAAKVFKDHNEDLKALRAEMNFIAKDASLTWSERRDKMREIREQMNDIYRSGVKDAKALLTYAGDIYGGKDMNKDIYDGWQADTKGPDWVIDHMSDSAKVKWDTVKSEYSSADPQGFVDTYNYFSTLKGDKDENGKTVHDSKRTKFVKWLESQDMSAAEKQAYYKAIGGYKTEATFTDGGTGTRQSSKDALAAKAEEIKANAQYLPVKDYRVSSEFGMRTHPISGKQKMHYGVDLAAKHGSDVVSAKQGTVEFAGSRGGYGNRVVIDHGNGMKTTYSHLSEIGVKEGDKVDAGTLIAKVGSTGASTGPHLHFEVEINGSYVNPRDYFDFDNGKSVTIAKNDNYSGYAPTKSSGGGGGGRKSGGKKSGGSSGGKKGKVTTQAAYTPTYAPTKTRSSASSGSSGGKSSSKAMRTPAARRTQTSVAKGIMLPTAREIDSAKRTSTPTVARNGGKSASRGIVLPTAAEVASASAGARIGYGSGTSSIRRTNRSRGSFWHENILG